MLARQGTEARGALVSRASVPLKAWSANQLIRIPTFRPNVAYDGALNLL